MEIIETRVSFDADFKINMDSEVSEFTMDYPITVKKKKTGFLPRFDFLVSDIFFLP